MNQRSYGCETRPTVGRLSVMGKFMGVLAAMSIALIALAGPASAIEPAPRIHRTWTGAVWTPRTWHPPTATARVAVQVRLIQPAPRIHRTWHPTTYRVKAHDTLWRISVRFCGGTEHDGQKWRQLARANHVQGTRIYVGQILRLRCTR